jgi:hypothetical protein
MDAVTNGSAVERFQDKIKLGTTPRVTLISLHGGALRRLTEEQRSAKAALLSAGLPTPRKMPIAAAAFACNVSVSAVKADVAKLSQTPVSEHEEVPEEVAGPEAARSPRPVFPRRSRRIRVALQARPARMDRSRDPAGNAEGKRLERLGSPLI